MKFINSSYHLPLTLTTGLGYNYGAFTLALDADYEPLEEDFKLSLGSEWQPLQFLSIRGGYFLNILKSAVSDQTNILSPPSKGLGGGMGINISNYSLNYAVVPYYILGTTQRVSLTGKF
ncbi:MAG: hypothetical protein ACQEQC_03460 [Elusimicrobiota bacterium]